MRGRDEETGEFHDKSRKQKRNDALDVLALGEKLVSLTPAQLARLPVPEDLLPHIAECKRITAHIAHKRQLAFLAKHMRREEESALDAIREALDANSDTGRREVAMMHRAEDWREKLMNDGDAALSKLLGEYPQADRQELRTLVRNAQAEKAKNKPPRAYREIFQVLRALMLPAALGLIVADSDEDVDADESSDATEDAQD
ncbi:ribosome-associated protein [Stenotrophomonas sp. 169]|uniref:ribosome biogenesis factor YjgA n=1 Tax=unclassified Stenotrophomonas TaxID=196198 RepID=UPI0016627F84|nr:ribosome biogenesis factor YjgA [Stenotrophomonas sp. 169]QNR98488.1 ribosome-associated protein [Stenotrophomonas sp. 169]